MMRLNATTHVMAGPVPAIHVFVSSVALKTWMPATQASEATPFFERLCAGMTLSSHDTVIQKTK
jgi:hypothetical protein